MWTEQVLGTDFARTTLHFLSAYLVQDLVVALLTRGVSVGATIVPDAEAILRIESNEFVQESFTSSSNKKSQESVRIFCLFTWPRCADLSKSETLKPNSEYCLNSRNKS